MVGTWNMGQLKNVYNILETEPQGNVKIMWVYTHIIFILPYIHSFIYSHSIDHTDVEFVIKYKYKQATIYKYKYNFR